MPGAGAACFFEGQPASVGEDYPGVGAGQQRQPRLWRGVISLGSGPDGKRIRRKVSGQTKAIVSDRLTQLHRRPESRRPARPVEAPDRRLHRPVAGQRHPHRGSVAQALADLA